MRHFERNEITPLEALNLYTSQGLFTGNEKNSLHKKLNRTLTLHVIIDQKIQEDLVPLIYHIIEKQFPKLAVNNKTREAQGLI